MAVSLAEKLGAKHNLSTFSVHPGLVITNLGSHLKLFGDDASDMDSMSECFPLYPGRLKVPIRLTFVLQRKSIGCLVTALRGWILLRISKH